MSFEDLMQIFLDHGSQVFGTCLLPYLAGIACHQTGYPEFIFKMFKGMGFLLEMTTRPNLFNYVTCQCFLVDCDAMHKSFGHADIFIAQYQLCC